MFTFRKKADGTQEPVAHGPESETDAAYVDLTTMPLDRSLGQLLKEDICRKAVGVVIGQPSEDRLSMVVTDPGAIWIHELVEMATDHRFKPILLKGDENLIRLAWEFIYHTPSARQGESWAEWLEAKKFDSEDVGKAKVGSKEAEAAEITGSAVARADKILKEAIASRASDIHLETFEDCMLIRYRVDGVLRIMDEVRDPSEGRALIKRFKVMAEMDITNDRISQGGRISVEIGGKGYDLRVSCVPVPEGESLVMRVLGKGAFQTTLEDLGFSSLALERYRHFIEHPHGMILTCGPTGSGKSTTLYASLKSIARPDRKLLTVEDPIEYRMPGIIQVQVNQAPKEPDKRVTFASALREFLRQDPDVILVGEVRDQETAAISVQAALTGHLVFSTLHTNSAVGVVTRLKDLKVPTYTIAATLIGAVAQRLVRRICPDCAEKVEPTDEQRRLFASHGIEHLDLRAGQGCGSCRRTGYKGRLGIYEVFTVTDEVKELIEQDATSQSILRQATMQGMKSLAEDGLAKAAEGKVTVDEIQRVCSLRT